MIKNQWRGQVLFGKGLGPLGVVASLWDAGCLGNKYGGDRVMAGVALWIGLGVKLLQQLNVQAGFFFGLSHGGFF